jgi:hypothetical protein
LGEIQDAYDAFGSAADTGALKVAMFGDAAHLSAADHASG